VENRTSAVDVLEGSTALWERTQLGREQAASDETVRLSELGA
jgi:hypothetical protein